jgi:hypothetical protein
MFGILYLPSARSDEKYLATIEELSSKCEKHLQSALALGSDSDLRKGFEADLKEIRNFCGIVQKDINKSKLGINLLSDINFIHESFDKIKKMKQLASGHYLFDDIEHAFSEFKLKMKDVRETGLYTVNPPTQLKRSSDYLLELEYWIDKLSSQKDAISFCEINASRIKLINETTMARVSFLAGKVQNEVTKRRLKMPSLSTEANMMLDYHRKILFNITGKNAKSIKSWKESVLDMKKIVKEAINAGIKVPVK